MLLSYGTSKLLWLGLDRDEMGNGGKYGCLCETGDIQVAETIISSQGHLAAIQSGRYREFVLAERYDESAVLWKRPSLVTRIERTIQ